MWERGLSGPHILIILILLIVLFGAKRIPEIARSLGRSMGEFKKGRAEGEQAARDAEREQAEKDKAAKDKSAGA